MKPDFIYDEFAYFHVIDNIFIVPEEASWDGTIEFSVMEFRLEGFIYVTAIDSDIKRITKKGLEKIKKETLATIEEIKKDKKEAYSIFKKFMFNKELESVLSE